MPRPISICPDMQITAEDLVAEGERVIAFWTFRGTHQGEFWGVQPTGRHIVGSAISTPRVQNGQVVDQVVGAPPEELLREKLSSLALAA